ncbi:MAG: general secretion pathway protein GspK [Sphingomonas sp. SCN 67-18]|uniref:type II secretion system minor pseudopilin GspK n=1 Tax=uncultured Sphingomonas sp. TaxID=158754 RepID=UPI00086F4C6E|nr:type II secretion system minor pseudopilin GspK [Sphingomonas sp. SCN 67-18]ODU21438.1 MAG: general secretion pathway protein GspK [Sphingomonas sp. SCN 67-18]
MRPRRSERGAALLTVLLLVAVMAILSATALEKLRMSTRLAGNALALDQARAFAMAAETVALGRIDTLIDADPGRTTLAGGWNGRQTRLPLPGGIATVRVTDGGNCFNLNSVVSGQSGGVLETRPMGVAQFAALMEAIGIGRGDAARIAASLADWIDSDDVPGPLGAEDAAYRDLPTPYRTGGTLLADVSELRAVAGVTADIYKLIRPWTCALPVTDLSPINVNTLLPEQAPLFVMLMPDRLTLDRARRLLSERPVDGYASLYEFWKLPALDGLGAPPEVSEQTTIRTRWFAMEMRVELGGADLDESALVDAGIAPARLVRRSWGEAG